MTAPDAQPHDHDASAPSDAAAGSATPVDGVVSDCPLCGAPVQANELRCPRCNMTLAGIDGRPGPFSRSVLVGWAAAIVVIYLVVLGIVALVPA